MTDDELDGIEEDWRGVNSTHAEVVHALVAEVRRLRALTEALEERVAMYEGRATP